MFSCYLLGVCDVSLIQCAVFGAIIAHSVYLFIEYLESSLNQFACTHLQANKQNETRRPRNGAERIASGVVVVTY